jgi:hypothetical protein
MGPRTLPFKLQIDENNKAMQWRAKYKVIFQILLITKHNLDLPIATHGLFNNKHSWCLGVNGPALPACSL